MNNANNSQSSLVPAMPHRLMQSHPSATTAYRSPARLVNTNQTATAYHRPTSQTYQRRQTYQQQQAAIRQHATVTQTQTLASARVTPMAPATQATPALASMPQARNTGRARTFNRRVNVGNRGSTLPSALRARLAGRRVDVSLHFDLDGNLGVYLYQHDEFILGPVNEWGGAASGYGLFPI